MRVKFGLVTLVVLGALVHGYLPVRQAVLTVIEDPRAHFVDLPSFYFAAQAVFNLDLSPYDLFTIAHYSEVLGQRIWPYVYPPATLFFLYPLSLADYPLVAAGFVASSLVLSLYLLVRLYQRHVRHLPSRIAAGLIVFALILFDPITQTLVKGQVNLVVLVLILFALDRLGSGRSDGWVGVTLGLATLIKTYPVILLGALLIRRDYRPVGAAAATWLGCALLSLAVLPADLWRQWLIDVVATGSYANTPFSLLPPSLPANQGFNGFFSRLIVDARTAALVTYCASAGIVAGTAYSLWRCRMLSMREYYPYAFAVILPAILLIAPLSWLHHQVFLLPVLFYLVENAYGPSGGGYAQRAFALLLFVALALPFNMLVYGFESLVSIPTSLLFILWLAVLREAPVAVSARIARNCPSPAFERAS